MTLERWIPRCSNVGFACQLPQPAPPKVKVRDNKKGGHPHGERLKTGGMAVQAICAAQALGQFYRLSSARPWNPHYWFWYYPQVNRCLKHYCPDRIWVFAS